MTTKHQTLREQASLLKMLGQKLDRQGYMTDAKLALFSASTILALLDEVEAMRVDAERYRWLRERHNMTHQDWHVRDPFNNPPDIGGLDQAIDAARHAQGDKA